MQNKNIIYENDFQIFDIPKIKNINYFIKICLYPFFNIFYCLICKFSIHSKAYEKKYKVSICAIFRDEAAILKEWIEYHKIVGIEHIYLYNNFSKDNYMDILEPYIKEGFITLTNWDYERQQMQAYADCVKKYKNESEWIGFIDLDEFIVPNGQNQTVYDFLKQFTNKAPFVIIYWKYFGSNGLIERNPNSLVTETFKSCWYKYSDLGKYFYNTKFDYDSRKKQNGYMHNRWGSINGKSIPSMNEFGKFVIWGINKVDKVSFPIQINHYVIKTYKEYIEKKAKRGGGIHAIQEGFHDTKYFFDHEKYCQSTDNAIDKYLIQLKLAMTK